MPTGSYRLIHSAPWTKYQLKNKGIPMNKFTNIIVALSGSIILAGCVIEDGYSSDYYHGGTTTYTTTTDYGNHHRHHRPYEKQVVTETVGPAPARHHHHRKKPYESQTVTESVGTPPANNGYPSYPSNKPYESQTVTERVGPSASTTTSEYPSYPSSDKPYESQTVTESVG
jgi:hypothetical protein